MFQHSKTCICLSPTRHNESRPIQGAQGWQSRRCVISIIPSHSHDSAQEVIGPQVRARRHLHEQGVRYECYTLEYGHGRQPTTPPPTLGCCQLSATQCTISVEPLLSIFVKFQAQQGAIRPTTPCTTWEHSPTVTSAFPRQHLWYT